MATWWQGVDNWDFSYYKTSEKAPLDIRFIIMIAKYSDDSEIWNDQFNFIISLIFCQIPRREAQ